MLIPFGIFSASAVGSDYELIETQILGSAVASITFSSLDTYASIYEHLQVRAVVRTTRATFQNGYFQLTFNGDSTASYTNHFIYQSGTTPTAFANTGATSIFCGWVTTQNAAASQFGASIIDITDAYNTTKNKTVRTLNGVSAGTDPRINLMSGAFLKTNALTSLTIAGSDGNLITGSRFSLYGIK
jgi:hypothetical protein